MLENPLITGSSHCMKISSSHYHIPTTHKLSEMLFSSAHCVRYQVMSNLASKSLMMSNKDNIPCPLDTFSSYSIRLKRVRRKVDQSLCVAEDFRSHFVNTSVENGFCSIYINDIRRALSYTRLTSLSSYDRDDCKCHFQYGHTPVLSKQIISDEEADNFQPEEIVYSEFNYVLVKYANFDGARWMYRKDFDSFYKEHSTHVWKLYEEKLRSIQQKSVMTSPPFTYIDDSNLCVCSLRETLSDMLCSLQNLSPDYKISLQFLLKLHCYDTYQGQFRLHSENLSHQSTARCILATFIHSNYDRWSVVYYYNHSQGLHLIRNKDVINRETVSGAVESLMALRADSLNPRRSSFENHLVDNSQSDSETIDSTKSFSDQETLCDSVDDSSSIKSPIFTPKYHYQDKLKRSGSDTLFTTKILNNKSNKRKRTTSATTSAEDHINTKSQKTTKSQKNTKTSKSTKTTSFSAHEELKEYLASVHKAGCNPPRLNHMILYDKIQQDKKQN